jgi:hypothetical protein
MGNFLSKFNANKHSQKRAHAHYWLLHAVQGFYPKGDYSLLFEAPIQRGLLAAQARTFSALRLRGLLAHKPKYFIPYIYVFVKLLFDFLRRYYGK